MACHIIDYVLLSKIVYPDRFKIDIVYAFIWVSLSQKGPEIQMMWQIGTIAFGLDKLEKGVAGKEVYYCTKCNQRVSFDTNSQLPVFARGAVRNSTGLVWIRGRSKYALHVIKNMISMTCIARIILLQ